MSKNIQGFFVFLAMVAFIAMILGCCMWNVVEVRQDVSKDRAIEYKPVHRVIMHEPNDYSLLVELEPGKPEMKTVRIFNHSHDKKFHSNPLFIADVPEDKPMWARVSVGKCGVINFYYGLEIHIHSGKDLEGGAWQRREGKTLKKGQNNVIE